MDSPVWRDVDLSSRTPALCRVFCFASSMSRLLFRVSRESYAFPRSALEHVHHDWKSRCLFVIPAKAGTQLMHPLILPLGRRWNERILEGCGVSEKNPAYGNPAMILLFRQIAFRSAAL
jgi:hypothetical protein